MINKIKSLIEEKLREKAFAGVVVRAVKGNEVIVNQAYGYASISPDKKKMNTETTFDIASLTKVVTTTIILRLISDKKLQLNHSVADCLSKVKQHPKLEAFFRNVTIKQLLTHTSGLLDWYPFYSRNMDFYEQLADIISNQKVVSGVLYSDLNFMLLKEIITEVSGFTIEEALDFYIRKPLKMTTMLYGPIVHENIASTEFGNRTEEAMCEKRGICFAGWRPKQSAIIGEVNDGNAHYYFNGKAGHAGIFANAEDLTKLGQLYVQGGLWDKKQLLNPELVKDALEEQVLTRGLGWQFDPMFPKGCGHTGFTGTSLWINPEMNLVVSLLTNRLHVENPINIHSFRKELHEIILEKLG